MGDKSKIEWTDATWNPVAGCSIVSKGCTNCYAMKTAARLAKISASAEKYAPTVKTVNGNPVWTGKLTFDEKALVKPLSWKRPRMIFVNSMSDLFHENVPDEWIDRIFAVMALCPQHIFQVLTKRPQRMREYFSNYEQRNNDIGRAVMDIDDDHVLFRHALPLKNVWLGVSVEDQKTADERIPPLLETCAAIRFISAEPLLGAVDLELEKPDNGEPMGLHWVICGGESGPDARPMHPDWARTLRDQCAAADVPFFFKQWGEYAEFDKENGIIGSEDYALAQSGDVLGWGSTKTGGFFPDDDVWKKENIAHMTRCGKKKAGNYLDGRQHLETTKGTTA